MSNYVTLNCFFHLGSSSSYRLTNIIKCFSAFLINSISQHDIKQSKLCLYNVLLPTHLCLKKEHCSTLIDTFWFLAQTFDHSSSKAIKLIFKECRLTIETLYMISFIVKFGLFKHIKLHIF